MIEHVVERRDGARIAWTERGQGPLVVMANQFFSRPEVFERLMADIARDHRLVTYDPRGIGASSRGGPYTLEMDAEDLGAAIEAAGPPALIIGMADGCTRAVKLAAARPDLVTEVVSPGGNPVGRRAAAGTDSLVGSQSVLDALMEMIRTDHRGALRSMMSTANPNFSDEVLRERVNASVEYCPQEVAVARMQAWMDADSLQEARALGDRLWLLEHGTNPWFPIEVARRTRALLPDAQVLEVEDGPLSRPDITASCVRRLTAARHAEPVLESAE